jgi:anaphase-promoting complex subunit 8
LPDPANRYVKEAKAALSHLAHVCMAADKYRPETCCVVGNYYSLKVACNVTP